MNATFSFDDHASLSRHSWVGLLSIFGLFGGLVYWTSTVEISGAVVAAGSIVVESYPKSVQHQEGGTVSRILVRDGQLVEAGQLLIQLNSTEIETSLAAVKSQWRDALVREARLIAEIGGKEKFDLPEALSGQAADAEISSMMSVESQFTTVRRTVLAGRAAQLAEQIAQLETQISGLTVQQTSLDEQLAILADEIADFEALQGGGLVEGSRVTALIKQRAQFEGSRGEIVSLMAGAKAAIAERRLQIVQLDSDFISAALEQLQAARREIADSGERMRAAQDRLIRTSIRAPQAGIVHESIVHTVGGVIGSGETLMQIVPQDDELMVMVRISPLEVDRVTVGQEATLRLVGLDVRRTPELSANVATVAPDVTRDPITAQSYYSAQLVLSEGELDRLPNPALLVPGMPIETFIKTDDRTALSYLIEPFVHQLERAFRED